MSNIGLETADAFSKTDHEKILLVVRGGPGCDAVSASMRSAMIKRVIAMGRALISDGDWAMRNRLSEKAFGRNSGDYTALSECERNILRISHVH